MKKHFLYLLILLIPVMNWAGSGKVVPAIEGPVDLFAALNLSEKGLSNEVFQLALKGYHMLEHNGQLLNADILTIVDFSHSSKNKRFYVIDLKNKVLLFNTYVAHGRNTGDEFARSFSNKEGSLKSSLGFYVTENPDMGSHTGFSLMINGVEKGINDNAEKRAIIVHAADYATEGFVHKYGRLGRSLGCPALPPELNKLIIDAIKGGTCLFLYNPDKNYLSSSSMLK